MARRPESPFTNRQQSAIPRVTSIDMVSAGLRSISELGGGVVDLIPRGEHKKHRYFRGASLGAAAYSLLHYDMLNTARDLSNPHMHFADGPNRYRYADIVAKSITRGEGYASTQLLPEMRQWLDAEAGVPSQAATPGIIFALHPDYNDYLLRDSDRGACEGVVWDGAVTLDMIDQHSREALEKIVG